MIDTQSQPQSDVSQAVNFNRADLTQRFLVVLRQNLFTNRTDIRPADLKRLAAAEVETLAQFIQQVDPAMAQQHGSQLCTAGLSEQSVMSLGQAARQYWVINGLTEANLPVLNHIESFYTEALQGFFQAHTTLMLKEQERMRTALEKSLSRYTMEMGLAAEVAKAVTSTLDLDELLRTTVDTILTRYQFYYVGIFLADDHHEWAFLRAGTGQAGQEMLRRGHKFKIEDISSMIGWCMANCQPRIAQDVQLETVRFANPLLPETRSEVALPLITQGEAIGALTIQSREVAAFSERDLTVLQLVADQVAKAIENAKLFATAQASLQEAESVQHSIVQRTWSEEAETEGLAYLYEQSSDSVQLIQDAMLIDPLKNQEPLAIPIVLRGQSIGVIELYDQSTPRMWSTDEVALAQTIAAQSALSLENARLFQETQRRINELVVLTRIGRRLASTLDLDEILTSVVEESFNATNANSGGIVLYNEAESAFEMRLMRHPSMPELETKYLGQLFHTDEGLIGRVLASGEPLITPDVRQAAEYYELDPHTRSELIVPIRQGNLLLGAINLESSKLNNFQDSDLRLVEAMSDQAAVAITNARVERMREVDRLKTQFLANMSHELRTPLNSIIGFSRVMLRGIDGPLTEMQNTDLTSIYNSGQHLLGLINNILDISKIEAGKMELSIEPVNLVDVAKTVMSTAIALIKDKPIKLESDVPQDLPTVMADQTRIRQIILNLVSNAAKFTEKGFIRLRMTPAPQEVLISVTDTGIGIPADKLGHIFEEFTQVDASTTRKYGGTGLGLAITRSFVEMHKGRIWVESELGVGSTFTFTLPREQAEPETPVGLPTDLEARGAGKKLIMCVDDDPTVITLYKRYLEKQGYAVIGVTDSTKAVAEAKRLLPYAITLDVLMPNQDGWQTLANLKKTPEVSNTPILVCSIIQDKTKGFSLGAADYLVKPVTEDELLRALNRVKRHKDIHKVLIVDDEPSALQLLRRILESQPGFQVQEANGGEPALTSIQADKPELILLDLMMPEVDGFAVLEALKSNSATVDIPVIIVTAKEITQEDRERLDGHMVALFNKGMFTADELLENISQALANMNQEMAQEGKRVEVFHKTT